MGTPCDICLDELCGGKHNCHRNTCELSSKCYRRLHSTIRIINRCTQRCRHFGRGELLGGDFYNFMGNFCSESDKKYGFLIDEIGNIYKCSMGVLDYAKIDDFLKGGFSKRFKEFNKKVLYPLALNVIGFLGEGRVVSRKTKKHG